MIYTISVSVDKNRMKDKKYKPSIPAFVNLYGFWNKELKVKEIYKNELKEFLTDEGYSESQAARIIKEHKDMGILTENKEKKTYVAAFPKGETFFEMRSIDVQYYLENLDFFDFKLLCLLGHIWEVHLTLFANKGLYSFSGNGLANRLGYTSNTVNRDKVNESLGKLCKMGLVKCSEKPYKKEGAQGLYRDLFKVSQPKIEHKELNAYSRFKLTSLLEDLKVEEKAIEQIFKIIEGNGSPHEDTD